MLLMKDIIDDSNELIRTVSKEVELPKKIMIYS